ncbi:MAG: YdeI/OmpD-associated family protein [Bacteroidetes bacterium]|nr:YdeI/OmpD-associated family protein [Bacteroidota bacterium]
MEMTKDASLFFLEGCGRCPKGGTPECKVHRWTTELALLRSWILMLQFKEECKWGVPCYTFQGRNMVMLSALKDHVVLSFLEGSSLNDPSGLLQKAGPNSVRDRIIRWNSLQGLKDSELQVIYLLKQHQVNKPKSTKGIEPSPEGTPEYPLELKVFLKENPEIAQAFEALTPGRRRGYLLHIAGAAQAATRLRRIESAVPKILTGKGLQES